MCAVCPTPRLNQSYELRPPWEQHLRYVPHRVRNGYKSVLGTEILCSVIRRVSCHRRLILLQREAYHTRIIVPWLTMPQLSLLYQDEYSLI